MSETQAGQQEAGAVGLWHRYRLLIILTAIGIAIIAWLAVSKGMAIRQVEQAAAAQRTELLAQAAAQQAQATRQALTMFAVPLAWAIRRELMADNLDQVDQYVTDLVKMKGFERVVVAKPDGTVVVASDRKNLGAAFASLYAERHLAADQVGTEETAPGRWLVVVPVMGLSARLGTLAIEYQAPASAPAK
jgi:cobalamin synthase